MVLIQQLDWLYLTNRYLHCIRLEFEGVYFLFIDSYIDRPFILLSVMYRNLSRPRINEITIWLFMQFFPNEFGFTSIDPEGLREATEYINHRPRKILGLKPPYGVLSSQNEVHHDLV